MALHRSSKFNAADGLFETEKPVTPIKEKEQKSAEKRQKTEKKAEETEIAKNIEESDGLIEETTSKPTVEPSKQRAPGTDYMVTISTSKDKKLNDESPDLASSFLSSPEAGNEATAPAATEIKAAPVTVSAVVPAEPDPLTALTGSAPVPAVTPSAPLPPAKPSDKIEQSPGRTKKLSATAIMPRKVPKKASESVINRTYTIDQGTYDLMSALVRFMRDSKVKDEETGYLINESAFIRRAIRTEMDRVFDSNDEDFSDSVRQYLDKPLKSSPSKITY